MAVKERRWETHSKDVFRDLKMETINDDYGNKVYLEKGKEYMVHITKEISTSTPISTKIPTAQRVNITIGSSKDDVLRIQGEPERVELVFDIQELWYYER